MPRRLVATPIALLCTSSLLLLLSTTVPQATCARPVQRDPPAFAVGCESLPPRWDWRVEGKVGPVVDQEECDAGYAFAAIAGLESRLLLDGSGGHDLSENHAKECNWEATHNYWDPLYGPLGSCHGGNARMVANLLSQVGAVLESCDPYISYDTPCKSGCAYQETVLGWRLISKDRVPSTDVLKWYIYTYGPVQTTLYTGWGDDWFEEFALYDGSYTLYYEGTEEPNHSVLIVGWDDGLVHRGGTGGWIVKNSRGSYWGGPCGHGAEGGYFTIAYGSASIGMYSSFFDTWQDYDAQGKVMYYDEAGWNEDWGYGSLTAWALCRFFAESDGQLVRVEFWTTDAASDVDIYIYRRFDGAGPKGLLRSIEDRTYSEAGYHSVRLESPLPVRQGEEVVAVVKITNVSYARPIAADVRGPSELGRTYISRDGRDGSWEDVGLAGGDLALRLRLSGVLPAGTATLQPTPTCTLTAGLTPTQTAAMILTPTRTETRAFRSVYLPVVQREALRP